jgi:hypothetical protein
MKFTPSFPRTNIRRLALRALAPALLLAFSLPTHTANAADEITSILNKIDKRDTAPKTENTKAEKKKPSSSTTQAKKKSAPKIPIWAPRDKLPKDIVGHGVAGNFVVQGEDATGGATLIPAEDAANPFARQFTVANMSTGMPRGTLVPITQRRLVQIPRNKPLIFIGRGIVPGTYIVEAR